MFLGIIIGALGSSIFWFFFIRNNKKLFEEKYDELLQKYNKATGK